MTQTGHCNYLQVTLHLCAVDGSLPLCFPDSVGEALLVSDSHLMQPFLGPGKISFRLSGTWSHCSFSLLCTQQKPIPQLLGLKSRSKNYMGHFNFSSCSLHWLWVLSLFLSACLAFKLHCEPTIIFVRFYLIYPYCLELDNNHLRKCRQVSCNSFMPCCIFECLHVSDAF